MSVVLRGVSFVVLASACAPASPAPSRVDALARIPTVAISSAPPPPATVETPEPVAPPSFAPVPGFPHAVKVSVPPSVAVALDTWGDGACALTKDRAVWCWDTPKPDSPEGRSPKRVDGVDGAELLSNGRGHVCAGDDRSVVCWGATRFDGEDNASAYEPEAKHRFARPFAVLSVGDSHACGVDANARVACWGDDSFGAVGNAPKTGDFVDVSSSSFGSCAVRAKGSLTCWGSATIEAWGPGGPGWSPPSKHLTEARDMPGISDVVHVSLRFYPWCIVRRSGEVMCWLGGGTDHDEVSMVPAAPLSKSAVARGVSDAIAIGGAIVTRKNGAIAGVTTADANLYVATPIGEGVLRHVVSADGTPQTGCAVEASGDVVCWTNPPP